MFAEKYKLATGKYSGNFNNPKWPVWYSAVMSWMLILAVIVFEFDMLTINDSYRNYDWTARRRYFRVFTGFGAWKLDHVIIFVFQAGIKVYPTLVVLDQLMLR